MEGNGMTDLIVVLILAAVLGGAGYYVYRAKKSGAKCIGCPSAKQCSGSCPSCRSEEKPEE